MFQIEIPSLDVQHCPRSATRGVAHEIRRRGNVPVAFGQECVIELTPVDIRKNWFAAREIRPDIAGAFASELSQRFFDVSPSDDDAAEHAGEAAACFFLSVRHAGLALHEALQGCRVSWDRNDRTELVECLA
jgi:hypothetical protein